MFDNSHFYNCETLVSGSGPIRLIAQSLVHSLFYIMSSGAYRIDTYEKPRVSVSQKDQNYVHFFIT